MVHMVLEECVHFAHLEQALVEWQLGAAPGWQQDVRCLVRNDHRQRMTASLAVAIGHRTSCILLCRLMK